MSEEGSNDDHQPRLKHMYRRLIIHTVYSARHTAFYLYIKPSQEAKNQQMMPKLANKAFLEKFTQIMRLERRKEPYDVAFWTCKRGM